MSCIDRFFTHELALTFSSLQFHLKPVPSLLNDPEHRCDWSDCELSLSLKHLTSAPSTIPVTESIDSSLLSFAGQQMCCLNKSGDYLKLNWYNSPTKLQPWFHFLEMVLTRIATAELATATWPILSGTCTTGTNRNGTEPNLGDVFDIGKNRFLRVRSESLWDSLKWWCLRKWSSGHVVDWAFWEFFPCLITQFLAQNLSSRMKINSKIINCGISTWLTNWSNYMYVN